jgi:hypothetical protein
MTTQTVVAKSGKGERSTGESGPSGTRRFRRFHLRTATVGVDLTESPVVSFTTFLNNAARRLNKVAEQLVAGILRAEQVHEVDIRSARISMCPIDKILRRFMRADRGASLREAILDLCFTLEAVAQRAERHMNEVFAESIRHSPAQQRLYRHESSDKNFYVGGIGVDLKYGPDPFAEAVMDAIPSVLQQTQHLFAFAGLGNGPAQFAWESVDLVASQVRSRYQPEAEHALLPGVLPRGWPAAPDRRDVWRGLPYQ